MSIQDLKSYLGLYEQTISGGKFLEGRRFINYVILQGLQGGVKEEKFEDAMGSADTDSYIKFYSDQNKKYAQKLIRLEKELKELQAKNIQLKNAQSDYQHAQAQLSKCNDLSNQLRIQAEEAKKQEQIFRVYENKASIKFQECSVKSRDQRRECQKKEEGFENEIAELKQTIEEIKKKQRESEVMHKMEKAKLQRKYNEANNLTTITRGYERQENKLNTYISKGKERTQKRIEEKLNRRRQK